MDKNPQKSMHYIFIVASRFQYANKRSSYSSINSGSQVKHCMESFRVQIISTLTQLLPCCDLWKCNQWLLGNLL